MKPIRRFSWAGWCRTLCAAAFALCAGCREQGPFSASLGWTSMGTVARISAKASASRAADLACGGALPAVQEVYETVETRLSVWRKDSEIRRIGVLPEEEMLVRCDPRMRPCYAAAFRLMKESGGAFNPRWRGPETFDLGAIAKGFAVDLAAEALRREGCPEAGAELLLDLGGNLKVVAGGWRTGVRDPFRPDGIVQTVVLSNGMACATSGEYERGKHIYDGRTGKPAESGVASVTVIHPASAMLADGLSTTLFVLGRAAGEAFLKAHYPEARAIWIERGR